MIKLCRFLANSSRIRKFFILKEKLTARKPLKKGKVKWVDDMTVMASLHLPTSLVEDTRPDIPRPVPYRSRLGLMLPRENNTMQDELDKLKLYTDEHLMSVNQNKTKVLMYNEMQCGFHLL